MKYRLFVLLWIPISVVWAVDDLKFIDFKFKEEGNQVILDCEPATLISYEDMKNPRYGITREMIELSLDAPMRQIAFLLRTLDNNRAVLMGKSKSSLDILSIPLKLRARMLSGESLVEKEYFVTVGLSEKGAYLKYEGKIFDFLPATLNRPDVYDQFLKTLVFPFGEFSFTRPQVPNFVVDLYFTWPKLLIKEDDIPIFDLFPSGILWNKGPIRKINVFLGSAYFWKDSDNHLQMASGSVMKRYAYGHNLVHQVFEAEKDDSLSRQQIGTLEEALHVFPIDRKILEALMKGYLYQEMDESAEALISGMQPIFSTIREGLDHQESLQKKAERRRNYLLGQKQFFEKNKSAEVRILHPAANDLISGNNELEFEIKNTDSPVLSAYCYFDDQLIGELSQEPWKIRFTAGRQRALLPLKVVVYFENETYAENQIEVRTIPLDQQVSVNLVPLRVVVSKGGTGFMSDLKAEDFDIKENGVSKEVVHFSKERAPLRVAVLLDTSISMTGEKMDRAQYALYQFVSHLDKEDRVSLYTFDHKVMRLTDFTNDYQSLSSMIFNTSPQLSTSLNDACLAGIRALEGQNGTRILLILSDGTDTDSTSLPKHVIQALEASDVMVYSIVLPGNFAGYSNEAGNTFLKELAKSTGSVSKRLVTVNGLDEAMQKISDEFRAFYYLGYYSDLPPQAKRDLAIDVKGFRVKVRYRILQP